MGAGWAEWKILHGADKRAGLWQSKKMFLFHFKSESLGRSDSMPAGCSPPFPKAGPETLRPGDETRGLSLWSAQGAHAHSTTSG